MNLFFRKPKTFLFILLSLLFNTGLVGQDWSQRGATVYGNPGENSSRSVDINEDGSVFISGSPFGSHLANEKGVARVFEWDGTNWVQRGSDIEGEAFTDQFGFYVSINSSGSIIAVGAPNNDGGGANSGHVRVFEWNGTSWQQMGSDINGLSPGDLFGSSLQLDEDGDRIVIGSPGNDVTKVYEWNGSNWFQLGLTLVGDASGDEFGVSTDISPNGNWIAIGAPYNDNNGTNAGSAKIYWYLGGSWSLRGTIDGDFPFDQLGYSVGVWGGNSNYSGVIAVGAPGNDDFLNGAGQTKVYGTGFSGLSQRGQTLYGASYNNYFGGSISMKGGLQYLSVGAPFYDYPNTGNASGAVYSYTYHSGQWLQRGDVILGDTLDSYDYAGRSLSLSGDGKALIMGSQTFDQDTAGSAKVFAPPCPEPDILGNDTVCGFSGNYDNLVNYCVPFSGNNYSWSVDGGIGSSNNNCISIQWQTSSNISQGMVILEEIDTVSNCVGIDTFWVTIMPTPQQPNILGNMDICPGTSSEYVYCVSPDSADHFYWSEWGTAIVSGWDSSCVVISDSSLSPGLGYYAFGITLSYFNNGFGCSARYWDSLHFTGNLHPVILGPDTVCEFELNTYCLENGGHHNQWSISTGTIISNPLDSCVEVYSGYDNWDTLIVESYSVDSSCYGSDTLYVEVFDQPIAYFNLQGPDSVCQGDSILYCAEGDSSYDYHWTANGGVLNSPQGTYCMEVEWGIPGVGTVWVNVINPISGCDSMAVVYITILECAAICPEPAISGKDTLCQNEQVEYCSPLHPESSYDWMVTNANIISGQNTHCIAIEWNHSGTHELILSEWDSVHNCEIKDSLQVTVISSPAPNITGTDSSCEAQQNTYCTPSSSSNQFSWSVDGGSIISGQYSDCIEVVWSIPGIGTVSVEERADYGECICTGFDVLGVQICDTTSVGFEPFHSSGEHDPSVIVWPNPFSGQLNFRAEGHRNQRFHVKVLNILGETIYSFEGRENENYLIQAEKLSSGIYHYQLLREDGTQSKGKILKR